MHVTLHSVVFKCTPVSLALSITFGRPTLKLPDRILAIRPQTSLPKFTKPDELLQDTFQLLFLPLIHLYYISLALPAAESITISIALAAAHSLWSRCPCGNEQFFLLLFFLVCQSEYYVRSGFCLALMLFSTIVPD